MFAQSSAICSAYKAKNFSFTSTASRHLRRIFSLSARPTACAPLLSDSMADLSRFQMPPIGVIRRARAFGRDHGGPERSLRRANLAECRAVVRFLDPF